MANRILILIIFVVTTTFCASASPSTEQASDRSTENIKYLNKQSSPYLLNYVKSSVNWYPWHTAAFKKAEKENKMIIIDFGQLACDECYTNDKSIFENKAIAKFINDNFVAIKVDINQRPDLYKLFQQTYKAHTQKSAMGSITAMALPDGKPFWVEDELKQFSLTRAMNFFVKQYYKNSVKIEFVANQLVSEVENNIELTLDAPDFKQRNLRFVGNRLVNAVNMNGMNKEEINPMSSSFRFLMRHYHNTQDARTLETIEKSLNNLAMGQMYDHIGGGFFGMKTIQGKTVVDLGKSLYTNAQMVSLYTEAYKLTKNPLYKKVVKETLTFINDELATGNGSFYAGLQGKGGKDPEYYVWTTEEISNNIQNEMFTKVFNNYFNIQEEGNFEGKNILYRTKTDEELMAHYGLKKSELQSIINIGLGKLQKDRNSRIAPQVDNQIVTAYNSLVVKAFVDAYRTFGTEKYLETAKQTSDFIANNMKQKGNRLMHDFNNKKSANRGYLDDYANTIEAYVSLYQASFNEKWLYEAKKLSDYAMKHFQNPENGMFNYANNQEAVAGVEEAILVDVEDNFVPSSNSTMAQGLFVLGLYFENDNYEQVSKTMLANVQKKMETSKDPTLYANWGMVYNFMVEEPYEVTIVGTDFDKLRSQLDSNFLPNVVLFGGNSEGTLGSMEGKYIEGETLIYVCKNKICKMPTNQVNDALALMASVNN